MTTARAVRASPVPSIEQAQLKERANTLRLMGLLAHWDLARSDPARLGWTSELLGWEENERARRSLERRLRSAHIGRFKPLADFDWDWPTHCDRAALQELMTLSFMNDATNVVLVGPSGVGKSMLASNLAHQALILGHTVLYATAGQLLGDLAALDSDSALRRRLRYLSYSNRHADLLFELISRRYESKSTVLTTNRPFKEWKEVFPNAACVVSLIDRLVHRCEVVAIQGESYRLKEAKDRAAQKAATRAATPHRAKKT